MKMTIIVPENATPPVYAGPDTAESRAAAIDLTSYGFRRFNHFYWIVPALPSCEIVHWTRALEIAAAFDATDADRAEL